MFELVTLENFRKGNSSPLLKLLKNSQWFPFIKRRSTIMREWLDSTFSSGREEHRTQGSSHGSWMPQTPHTHPKKNLSDIWLVADNHHQSTIIDCDMWFPSVVLCLPHLVSCLSCPTCNSIGLRLRLASNRSTLAAGCCRRRGSRYCWGPYDGRHVTSSRRNNAGEQKEHTISGQKAYPTFLPTGG